MPTKTSEHDHSLGRSLPSAAGGNLPQNLESTDTPSNSSDSVQSLQSQEDVISNKTRNLQLKSSNHFLPRSQLRTPKYEMWICAVGGKAGGGKAGYLQQLNSFTCRK